MREINTRKGLFFTALSSLVIFEALIVSLDRSTADDSKLIFRAQAKGNSVGHKSHGVWNIASIPGSFQLWIFKAHLDSRYESSVKG